MVKNNHQVQPQTRSDCIDQLFCQISVHFSVAIFVLPDYTVKELFFCFIFFLLFFFYSKATFHKTTRNSFCVSLKQYLKNIWIDNHFAALFLQETENVLVSELQIIKTITIEHNRYSSSNWTLMETLFLI